MLSLSRAGRKEGALALRAQEEEEVAPWPLLAMAVLLLLRFVRPACRPLSMRSEHADASGAAERRSAQQRSHSSARSGEEERTMSRVIAILLAAPGCPCAHPTVLRNLTGALFGVRQRGGVG